MTAAGAPQPRRRRRAERRSGLLLGRRGELAALILLAVKGYRLRHRNWRTPEGELDLVVERGGEVVFVEVKSRAGTGYGGAAAAVDADKRRRLARTASVYLSRFRLWDRPCRFDVVTVERAGGLLRWRLRHLPDAFRPDLGRLL